MAASFSAELPWLDGLRRSEILDELRLIATQDELHNDLFTSGFNPSFDLARPTIASWSSLDLMNKGRLLPGCQVAPLTCAALDGCPLREKLAALPWNTDEDAGLHWFRYGR